MNRPSRWRHRRSSYRRRNCPPAPRDWGGRRGIRGVDVPAEESKGEETHDVLKRRLKPPSGNLGHCPDSQPGSRSPRQRAGQWRQSKKGSRRRSGSGGGGSIRGRRGGSSKGEWWAGGGAGRRGRRDGAGLDRERGENGRGVWLQGSNWNFGNVRVLFAKRPSGAVARSGASKGGVSVRKVVPTLTSSKR
jgi:hypothetical protein